ncbi:MAG TPA: NAD-dependent protein deacetylase [Propionibacteriaceae bacterium]
MRVQSEVSLVSAMADLVHGRRWVVLTGAGMSTDSGIPDYRGPTSIRATPMQYAEFLHSPVSRQRYWARSHQGWRRIGQAEPNLGHRTLVELEQAGLVGVLTQNVDGLHTRAGSTTVISLHGEIDRVICLDCGETTPRTHLQDRLSALNPDLGEAPALEHAELRPDGDAVVEDWHDFVLADCLRCGGILKPDVVFFGETVPKPRVEAAYDLVNSGDVLVVLGSSLTVMSGLRFVRHSAKQQRPTVIVNRGTTRGDELASIKIEDGCAETLRALAADLSAR